MHMTALYPKLARWILCSGMLGLTISGYSMDGMATGGMAAAPAAGSGGGIAIELWFVLMLALLGAAQWLDQKEAKAAGKHGRPPHPELHRSPSGR
jgi:hypothetical protein